MNTANKLTILRIVLIPIFIICVLIPGSVFTWGAFIVFAIASFTDFLDGFIARKYSMITDLGKFMDPLADKLLIVAALTAMVDKNMISIWILFIVIARELIVTGLRMMAAGDGIVIAAGIWGKLKTVTQIILVLLALYPINIGMMTKVGGTSILSILAIIMAAITVLSGCEYIFSNSNVLKEK